MCVCGCVGGTGAFFKYKKAVDLAFVFFFVRWVRVRQVYLPPFSTFEENKKLFENG